MTANRSERREETPSNGSGWVQRALANCYFHTPLPALVRPVRERYCLKRSSAGGWPKLERRAGPTARILYYHRVNDDGDPFFPAITTALFEREMEFVAAHYTVVGLDQLLDHLDGNSPETVLAVTFDDGYEDNFTHAFPVLQRLGLPATIFLTTGSIDSREPLWFEELSLAIKLTPLVELTLETDPPMRFQLRTPAERLDCNGRIQEFLRGLSDAERRHWLSRILRALGVSGSRERHGKMLTWDQVRFMHSRGIDFGAHTITHPFLSRTTPEEADREIAGGKKRIEDVLQHRVRHFAYPNGHEADVSAFNRDAVRRAGFRAAVTTNWGINDSQTDSMELKRGGPWEPNPAQFAYKLDWYQLTNA